MIELYEIDWGAHPYYWDVYNSDKDFVRVVEADEIHDYLDTLRRDDIDFVLYTQEWYQFNQAMGGAVD